MVTNHEPAGELLIPTALPAHTHEQLAIIDAATIRAVDSLAMSSESYRHSAIAYRHAKQFVRADEADRMADLIDLDPRLAVAGTMYNTSTGTTRYFLHLYIALLQRQAQARQAQKVVAA